MDESRYHPELGERIDAPLAALMMERRHAVFFIILRVFLHKNSLYKCSGRGGERRRPP
jgi:hypothetical protein